MNQTVNSQYTTALRYALVIGGMWLVSHKYIASENLQDFIALMMIIVPPGWAFIQNRMSNWRVKVLQAQAVMAGKNSAAASQGVGLAYSPSTLSKNDVIAVQSAQDIIANHAPILVK